ncbi:MAG TPA: hypothetical protein VF334_14910 [Polyangia bacterium]
MRINGVGKLVAAFVFFLGASGLAIHEAKVPPPREEPALPSPPVDVAPPSRAIHDEVPPWVKYAAPPPRTVSTVDDGEIGDVIDVVDKCPDQPSDNDDSDGCPEPPTLQDRIILID